jgi:hypothetical protein
VIALSSSGRGSGPAIGDAVELPLPSDVALVANPFSRGIRVVLLAS